MTCPLCAYGEPHMCFDPIPDGSEVALDGEVIMLSQRPDPSYSGHGGAPMCPEVVYRYDHVIGDTVEDLCGSPVERPRNRCRKH